MTSEDVRRHNLGLVMAALARQPLSRSELADTTGLVRGSITSLSAELLAAGLIREADVIAPAGRGRPRTLLEIAADEVATVTAMLDAEHAVVAVSTLGGDDLLRIGRSHGGPSVPAAEVLDTLAAVIDEALDAAGGLGRTLIDLAVVVWAPVAGDPPVVLAGNDFAWPQTDVPALLGERIPRLAGRPLGLVSNTAAAARAEHVAAGAPSEFVHLSADPDLDGVIFAGGEPLPAAARFGGLGHLPAVPDGDPCTCGGRGCLLTVAGPDALLAAAGLAARAESEGTDAAWEAFVAATAAGEPRARQAWERACTHLVRAVQTVAMTTGTTEVVLGGCLASFTDDVTAELVREFEARRSGVPAPHVRGSELGADAALRGAEWAARARVIDLLLG